MKKNCLVPILILLFTSFQSIAQQGIQSNTGRIGDTDPETDIHSIDDTSTNRFIQRNENDFPGMQKVPYNPAEEVQKFNGMGNGIDAATATNTAAGMREINEEFNAQGFGTAPVLGQNYPNPVTYSTVIEYYLPHTAKVSISLFDNKGKPVKQIMNQDLPAGYHKVEIDASLLPAGNYIYRMTAGDFSDTKQMIVDR